MPRFLQLNRIITPLCPACGQQEETLEHLWYECAHGLYEMKRHVCEEWKKALAGWRDMLDAMRKYEIALAREAATTWQRDTRPKYNEPIGKLKEPMEVWGEVERQSVAECNSTHTKTRERGPEGLYFSEAQERGSIGAEATP